jgi:hypothetical protein
MKLPWYIKQVKEAPKTDNEGHLIVTFEFSKLWVYGMFTKYLIVGLFKKLTSWQ